MFKKIPFGSPVIGEKEKKAILDVMSGTMLTHGPRCEDFENKFAKYIGVKHAISTSNCTTAIHLGLIACNVQQNDEVIVPAMTHVATAHAVEHCGAKPVFVDVCEITGCINPDLIECKITSKTRAIIVVHFVGLPCDMDQISHIAKKYGLKVIEDSATALGATYDKKKTGSLSDLGCFSFYPTKHITSFEGGMLTTNDSDIAYKVKTQKAFGYNKSLNDRKIPGIYDINSLGWNYRMSEGHASVGIIQLDRLEDFLEKRKRNVKIITKNFAKLRGFNFIPFSYGKSLSSWYCVNLMIKECYNMNRNEIIKKINDLGIGTSVHYPISLPNSIYYSKKYGFKKNDFPIANKIGLTTISLPCGPHVSMKNADYIGKNISKLFQ